MYILKQILIIFLIGFEFTNCEILSVYPIFSNLGNWGEWDLCEKGSFITGFDIKSHIYLGNKSPFKNVDDNSGLISIVFQCSNRKSCSNNFIFSSVGNVLQSVEVDSSNNLKTNSKSPPWSITGEEIQVDYTLPLQTQCEGVAIGFQAQIQTIQENTDLTGVTNIRIICSGNSNSQRNTVEGYGDYNGDWTKTQMCGPRKALCGLQTQALNFISEIRDHLGVENIRMKCCELPNPVTSCEPSVKWESVESFPEATSQQTCNYTQVIGMGPTDKRTFDENLEFAFNEGVGFSLEATLGDSLVNSALRDKLLGLGRTEGYEWADASEKVWQPRITRPVSIDCTGASNFVKFVEIRQLVASCSYLSVRTGRFRRIDQNKYANGTIHEIVKEFGV